jgi:hypothetical protein
MPGGGSVPIVSQTEIDPMKTALSLMLALATTTALTEPLPVAKPQSPGGAIRPRNWSNRAKETGTRALIDGTLLARKVAMEPTVEQCTALTISARVAALRLGQ